MRSSVWVSSGLILALIFLSLPFWSYSTEKQALKEEAVRAIQRYYSLYSKGKLEEAYSDIPVGMSVFESGGDPLRVYLSQDAIVFESKRWDYGTFNLQQVDYSLTPSDLDVRVIGESVIATYTLHSRYQRKSDAQATVAVDVVTAVLEKSEGDWRFVHIHQTRSN